MHEFALRASGPSASPRARLTLDALESRVTPAQITGLTTTCVADGWFLIYGQVIADNPWGLTVEFTAHSDTIQGQRAEVEADGSFALFVDLTPSDSGFMSVRCQDWDGTFSDPVVSEISVLGGS